MLSNLRGSLARGLAVAGLAAMVLSVPAFAQETAPAPEYGQGAGVTRARTLPRTGSGLVDEYALPLAAGAAVLALGASGGLLYSRRQRLSL